ncbi:MAG: tetratricopeptide repeat protein [Bradyrhizobium sp.]
MVQAKESATTWQDCPAGLCREQLDRILSSSDFSASERERRFLSYVGEEALSGRGARIKAYSIGVEVFGRGETFNPQLDPIVRIGAGHLRRALERYYLTAGQADPILITIPKGGYVPEFSLRQQPPTIVAPENPVASTFATVAFRGSKPWMMAAFGLTLLVAILVAGWWWNTRNTSARTPEIPRVLVEKFDDLTGTVASAAVTTGLRQEVVEQLSKFNDIVVMESSPSATDTSVPAPRFVLAGSVDLSADTFRLRVRFTNRLDDSVLWAESYDGGIKVADLRNAQAEVAHKVAMTLAPSYGVIFSADSSRHIDSPPDDWAAYSCTLSFYAYERVQDSEARSALRICLEKAVDRFPNYASAWGLLSLIYVDDYRFQFPDDPASSQTALQRALVAAKRALEIDPRNIRGLHARMLSLYFNREIDAALAIGKRALAINPNDTELLGEYGSRLALSGDWPEGCALSAQAYERNPGNFGSYNVDLALCSYFTGDYQQAVKWINETKFLTNPVYHLVAAAVYAEGGYKSEAERERLWLNQNQPALVAQLRHQVSMRLVRPQDVEFALGSLRKAGFDIKD